MSDDLRFKQLMDQAKFGNRQAFGEIYDRFKGPILSYILMMVRDQGTAEDLMQETFLKAYRARESYSPQAKFSTWLWTIARNTAFDRLAKKSEVLSLLKDSEEEAGALLIDDFESDTPSVEDQLMQASSAQLVRKCIAMLSDRHREILGLRVFSDLSYEEIAEQTGLPLGTVKTELHRAKKQMEVGIRREGL